MSCLVQASYGHTCSLGLGSVGDLRSWHVWRLACAPSVGECIEFVCQAICVKSGSDIVTRLGVVCTSVVCCCAGLGKLVLGRLGASVPLPPCARALLSPSTLEGRVWWLPLTGLSWIPFVRLGLIRGPTLRFRHHSPSSSIVDEFKCG